MKRHDNMMHAFSSRTSKDICWQIVYIPETGRDVCPQFLVLVLFSKGVSWYSQVTAVDTNGAGDTFATAYMIALAARHHNPGQKASWAASRAVQQPQSCKPQCVTEAIQRELWPAR